VSSGVRVRV